MKEKIINIIEKPISGEWGNDGNRIKVLRTTNFTNDGEINYTNVVTRDISEKKISEKKLQYGDCILEKSGGSPTQPVGRVVFFDLKNSEEYLCNNFTTIIRPKNSVHSKYFFWGLFANHYFKKTLSFQNKTTGIINLKTERYLNDSEIPLPPLPIQQKIAEKLDKADALRKKDQQLLKYYDELAQSVFIEMFGDVITNSKKFQQILFEDIVTLKRGYDLPVQNRSGGAVPVVASTGVVGYHDVSKTKNPIIVTGRSGSIGTVQLISIPCWPLNTTLYSTKLHGNNPVYLRYFVENFDLKRFSHGAGVPTLDRKLVHCELAGIPPLPLQQKFATIIQNIEQQKQKVKLQSEESENLFQALLQESFA